MACFNARTDAETVVRHAWRLARGLHADLLAVSVTERPLEELPERERMSLLRNIRLAEDLGARVITVVDEDVVDGLARIVDSTNVTNIVVPARSRAPAPAFPSVDPGSSLDAARLRRRPRRVALSNHLPASEHCRTA